ncbi:MAG: ABC transporter ATP-binding protein [Terrimicrobiaceae bacterium]|nr:ABC transporter ATP-binding protein [Terrimicrobiaceae bacterium]
MALVLLQDVKKYYFLGGQEIRALDGVNLRIDEGEFVAITGPSGSGKSTLMHLLGCLDTPTAGRMEICGHDLSQATSDQLSLVRNREIGFVFQSFNLLSRLNVVENVEVPLIYSGVPGRKRREKAESLVRRVGLEQRMRNRPTQLSGGQCQRVAIARALVNDPRILFGDEPTGNLDSHTGELILHMFTELHQAGRTVVLVTHDPDVAAVTHRVIEIRDGRVQREYDPRVAA